jgi:hypothetical protein
LQSKLGNDAIDRAFADGKAALPKLLGNHVGAGFRIEKPVANDLANEFLSAAVVGLGTSFGAEESRTTLLEKKRPELEIALAAETEFGGGLVNACGAAFTVDEHGKLAGDLIVFGDRQGATVTLDAFSEQLDGNHGGASFAYESAIKRLI